MKFCRRMLYKQGSMNDYEDWVPSCFVNRRNNNIMNFKSSTKIVA